ncbi:DUF1799 domain-containing protein [Paracidovorax wautersii]|uniref:DUF1799 domain-containing protein n=1 Tax=Paracidovorax wautersii TaxID=1177982 RepID=UPI0031D349F2
MFAKLSAAGVVPSAGGVADEPLSIWPECVDAWNHWMALQTQWRMGMDGATGLDYAGVRAYLDEQGIGPGPVRQELFACLCACEAAFLDVLQDIRAERQRRAK